MNDENKTQNELRRLKSILYSKLDEIHSLKTTVKERLEFELDTLFGDLNYDINRKMHRFAELENELLNSRRNKNEDFFSKGLINNSQSNVSKVLDTQKTYTEIFVGSGVSRIYRRIAKFLHPDLTKNPELSKRFWSLLQIANTEHDSRLLMCIEDVILNISFNVEKKLITTLTIERAINEANYIINSIKTSEPYNLEDLIGNSAFIEERRQNIKVKILQLEEKIQRYESLLGFQSKARNNGYKYIS